MFRSRGGGAAGLWGVGDRGLLAEGAAVAAVPPVHGVIQEGGQGRREQLLFSFLCHLLHWAAAAPGTQRKKGCTSRILVNSPHHETLHFIYILFTEKPALPSNVSCSPVPSVVRANWELPLPFQWLQKPSALEDNLQCISTNCTQFKC